MCVCFGVRPYVYATLSARACMLVFVLCVFLCLCVYVYVYLSVCLSVVRVYAPEKDRKGAEKGRIGQEKASWH